jgi:hypothetical protein
MNADRRALGALVVQVGALHPCPLQVPAEAVSVGRPQALPVRLREERLIRAETSPEFRFTPRDPRAERGGGPRVHGPRSRIVRLVLVQVHHAALEVGVSQVEGSGLREARRRRRKRRRERGEHALSVVDAEGGDRLCPYFGEQVAIQVRSNGRSAPERVHVVREVAGELAGDPALCDLAERRALARRVGDQPLAGDDLLGGEARALDLLLCRGDGSGLE